MRCSRLSADEGRNSLISQEAFTNLAPACGVRPLAGAFMTWPGSVASRFILRPFRSCHFPPFVGC